MKTKQQSATDLAVSLGISELYLKREDEHKYGSHKGRSIPLMIKQYAKEGINAFAISSSGNAAIAAARATHKHNQNNPDLQVTLGIFVGEHIEQRKLKKIRQAANGDTAISVAQVERPKQTAFLLDKEEKAKNLRQSTDDLALQGYYELAAELNKLPNLAAIFIPTSSGTTAQAIAEAFYTDGDKRAMLEQKPQIHIVQTDSCHPIAGAFDSCEQTQESIAGAIVDNVAHRKERVVELVKQSGGSGWVVNDQDILAAKNAVMQKAKTQISANSALSVAGLKKAVENGATLNGAVVCLITGP